MQPFSKAQLEHVLNGDVLNAVFDELEKKFTKHTMAADTMEQAEPYRQKVRLLSEIKKELRGMVQTEKLKG